MDRISVIIPAYNAGKYLSSCIRALNDAGFAPDDIIVIDDGSTDDTVAVASAHDVTVLRHPANRGASAARNTGAAASEGNILFMIDADVMVHPDSKEIILLFFKENPSFGAVFGTYDDDPSGPSQISRARNLLHRFVHLENAGEVVSFWTGCGAVRKNAFESAGGFNENQRMMEDIDLGFRLAAAGERTMLLSTLQGKHLKGWSLQDIAKTDFFDRALPWARLLRDGNIPKQNNLNISNRSGFSVLAIALACCGVVTSLFYPVAGLVALLVSIAALVAINIRFLKIIFDLDGIGALPPAVLVLSVHYFCGGLGFALVALRLDRYLP